MPCEKAVSNKEIDPSIAANQELIGLCEAVLGSQG